jgi:tellurite resistance protein
MGENEKAIINALVSVAWADGRLVAQEEEMLEAAIASFDASDAEAEELREYARSPRTFADIDVAHLGPDDRRRLLDYAVVLTFIDGEQHHDERAMLGRLVQLLEMDPAESNDIIAAAEERARRLIALL